MEKLPELNLYNFEEEDFAGSKYVLTSPRSLESCDMLNIKVRCPPCFIDVHAVPNMTFLLYVLQLLLILYILFCPFMLFIFYVELYLGSSFFGSFQGLAVKYDIFVQQLQLYYPSYMHAQIDWNFIEAVFGQKFMHSWSWPFNGYNTVTVVHVFGFSQWSLYTNHYQIFRMR